MDRQKWSMRTMEYYLAMTRNEVLIHDTKCANLENIMLNGKKKKASFKRPYVAQFHLYEMSRTGKATEAKSRLEVAWGWRWGLTANGHEVSFGVNENILDLERGDGRPVNILKTTALCTFKSEFYDV